MYENVQRFLLFQLTINVAALGLALLGPFVGVKLPLTVMQMLWVNLIMDTFAALALATEPPHPHVLDRLPRRAGAFIVTRPMAVLLFAIGCGSLPDTSICATTTVSRAANRNSRGPTNRTRSSRSSRGDWLRAGSWFKAFTTSSG